MKRISIHLHVKVLLLCIISAPTTIQATTLFGLIDTVPSISCLDTVTVSMSGNTGSVTILADKLITSASDNATSEMDLRASAIITLATDSMAGIAKMITFTCADYVAFKNINVKVWVKNQLGNYNSCRTNVVLKDTLYVCRGDLGDPIAGIIATENFQVIQNVKVCANVPNSTSNASATTDANGSFYISILYGQDYQVNASKTTTEDKFAGVTTYDLALMSRHILGIESLNSPYKIIAADVDNSKEIDAADMLMLRRYILGITPTLDAGIWRFVDKSYIFQDAKNPLAENFREVATVSKSSYYTANFVAVKMGDLNQSYVPAFGFTKSDEKNIVLKPNSNKILQGAATHFVIMPNPVDQHVKLTFESSNVRTVRLLDNLGSTLLLFNTFGTSAVLDMSVYKSGSYTFEVTSEGMQSVQKFVKE